MSSDVTSTFATAIRLPLQERTIDVDIEQYRCTSTLVALLLLGNYIDVNINANEEEDLDVVVSGPKLKPTEMPLSSFVMMIIAESPKSRFYIYWGIMPERHEWEGCNGLQGWMEMIGRRMARL
ncbi:hypothetical protein BHM03_00040337 [Ensete ventricosum]|nr:hypothetical protein BHM03_00040337 [Ensete ventricosum]